MTNKKKTYFTPEMKVVELERADIIAASGGYNEGPMTINGGNNLLLDEDNW